jgi:hypothetical protein
MKLLIQIQQVKIFDAEEEIIAVEGQKFCFAHPCLSGGATFSRAVQYDICKSMSEDGEAQFRIDRVANKMKENEKFGFYKECVNTSRLEAQDWILLNRGQIVKIDNQLFTFNVDHKNNPFLKAVN